MTKHFENLWEEAENLNPTSIPDLQILSMEVGLFLQDNLSPADRHRILGEILFRLCQISKHYNINVYAALQETISEHKIEWLEPDK